LIFIVMNVPKLMSKIVLNHICKSTVPSVRRDMFDQTVGLTVRKLVQSTIVKHVKLVLTTCVHRAIKATSW
jgi:hypothetical protein